MKKLKSIVLLLVFAIVITGSVYAESIGADVIYSGGIVAEQTGAYQDYLKNPSAYTVIPEPVEFGKSESSAYLEEVMPEKYNTETDAGKGNLPFHAKSPHTFQPGKGWLSGRWRGSVFRGSGWKACISF